MIRLRVRTVAEQQGLHIQALADKTGLAYSTVLDVWHDKVRRIDKATLARLCDALGVQPGDLIVQDAPPPEHNETPGSAQLVAA